MFSKINSHVCALVLFLGCTNSVPSFNWVETLPKPWELSEDEFASYLPKFKEKYPDFHDRIKAINLWRVGTPYGIFKLGEEIDPDPDPIWVGFGDPIWVAIQMPSSSFRSKCDPDPNTVL